MDSLDQLIRTLFNSRPLFTSPVSFGAGGQGFDQHIKDLWGDFYKKKTNPQNKASTTNTTTAPTIASTQPAQQTQQAYSAPVDINAPRDSGISPQPDQIGDVGDFVNMLNTHAPNLSQWGGHINRYSSQYGAPPAVIAALMQIESGGNPNAQSPMNIDQRTGKQLGRAAGLMQVMPFHFREGENPFDPDTNLRVAIERVLMPNYKRYGNWNSAAAAYFGAVDAYGNPTTATDATGSSGHHYVNKFNNWLRLLGGG